MRRVHVPCTLAVVLRGERVVHLIDVPRTAITRERCRWLGATRLRDGDVIALKVREIGEIGSECLRARRSP